MPTYLDSMIVQVPIEDAYPDTVPSAGRRDMPGGMSTMDGRVHKLWSFRLSPLIVIERIARARVRADRSQHRE